MTTINVRIEEKTKKAASKTLAAMGLDLSTGVKIFLHQVVTDQSLPFRPTKQNSAALAAQWDREIAEARRSKRFKGVDEILKGL